MLLEQKLTILEKRIKAIEDRVDRISKLEGRIKELRDAQAFTDSRIKDTNMASQEIFNLKEQMKRLANEIVAVENKLPGIRKEIQNYSRDSNMGILFTIGVFVMLGVAFMIFG